MRITNQQIQSITEIIHQLLDQQTSVYLFGSRLNPQAKGGDIDLLIESDQVVSFLQKAKIKMSLENQLGLPVDLICKTRHRQPTPFQAIALSKALQLTTNL